MKIVGANTQKARVQLRVSYFDADLDCDVNYLIHIRAFDDISEADSYAEKIRSSQDMIPEVLAAHKRDFKCWQVSKVLGLEIATMAHAVAKTYSLPTHRIAA